jgi:hypothetical protein
MIEEDYVSFETAKLLKEKGFDEMCFQYWHEKDNELVHSQSPHPIRNITNPCFFGLAAPTLQMAMKWLREVHSCYINTYWEFKNYNENGNPVFKDIIWSYNISIPKYNSARKGDGDYFDMDSEKEDYTTYEEVCEAAIKYCLENLI